MRVAIVSDIHGNRTALKAVLADLHQTSPDLIYHGGDLAANGAHPAEVVDTIHALDWPGVCGNTDEMLWAPERLADLALRLPKLKSLFRTFREMIPTTRDWLGENRLDWLRRLPEIQRQDTFALTHASPKDLWRAPMPAATDPELRAVYGDLGAPIVVYAHIHRPFVRRLPEMCVANTGSVSLSYDGDTRASYLVIDDHTVSIRRVEYDVEREADELRSCGLPHADWLRHVLRTGKYCHPPSPPR
jgi:putative phosphoesterase